MADTGKFVILPVDQGFEHGPARSFAPNPPGYNPHYHFELALEAGCNAYAAPLGFLEAGARTFAGELPLILKLNSHEMLHSEKNPMPAVTASVEHALRLGCAAIGFTIYPGSALNIAMYEQIQAISEEAKAAGLVVVVWSYPRGEDLSKAGETAIDVACYAAQSAFDGRRIVIFSGGAAKGAGAVYEDARAIRDGGGFGSIIGRNSFQRPKDDAIKMLRKIMNIYLGKE